MSFLLSTETGDFLAPRFLGLIYEEQNKLNLAEKYYKIAADRKNFDAYVNLGFLFQRKMISFKVRSIFCLEVTQVMLSLARLLGHL